jgi:hypothetical protein
VLNNSNTSYQTFRKVFLLTGLYLLHLLCFQTVVAFGYQSYSAHPATHHRHPAGQSDEAGWQYRMLLKHDGKQHVVDYAEHTTLPVITTNIPLLPVCAGCDNVTNVFHVQFPLSSVRRCNLLQVFRI